MTGLGNNMQGLVERVARSAARSLLVLSASAFILLPVAYAQTPAPGPGLPIWIVKDEDSTIYITGTVHILRDGAEWMGPKLDSALDASTELRLELAEIASPAALQAGIRTLLPEYGAYEGPPITSLLTPEENAALVAELLAVGAPDDALALIDTHQPWFAIQMLGRDYFTGVHKFSNGIDNVLARWATDRGVPVKGMESLEVQIALAAGSTFDEQMAALRFRLKPSPAAQLMNQRVIDAAFGSWLRGETSMAEALVMFMRIGSASGGGSTDPLLKNRNEAWAATIEDMLAGSGVSFIAVGAAHLVGPDSLQSRLKLRGITAERH
jgi:uncharacterized protein